MVEVTITKNDIQRGTRERTHHRSWGCPLAQALNRELGVKTATVSQVHVGFAVFDRGGTELYFFTPTPPEVAEWITKFDKIPLQETENVPEVRFSLTFTERKFH